MQFHVDVLIEFQPKARVAGAVRHKAREMHHGAVVDGVLAHFDGLESERPSLKLASSRD